MPAADNEDAAALQDVLDTVRRAPCGSELLLTAFSASVGHYRRASVCTPFPRLLFPGGSAEDLEQKDFARVSTVLQGLPAVSSLASVGTLQRLSKDELLLLRWLL